MPWAVPDTASRSPAGWASMRSRFTASSRSWTEIASLALPEDLMRLLDQHNCARGAELQAMSSAKRETLRYRPSRLFDDSVSTPPPDTTWASSRAGALASTTWQLVPPIPKLDTPAYAVSAG